MPPKKAKTKTITAKNAASTLTQINKSLVVVQKTLQKTQIRLKLKRDKISGTDTVSAKHKSRITRKKKAPKK